MHFYNISQGSLEEVRYYLRLAKDLGYAANVDAIVSIADETARMLHGLITSIEKKKSVDGRQ